MSNPSRRYTFAMEFRVPPDCKDSSFHHKWRLHLLQHVQNEAFWRQNDQVRQAVKTFLDHPTSLPYEHDKISNFMTNSMIIVDKEVLNWALEWFKPLRISFFASLENGRFVPAAEMPPPPQENGADSPSDSSCGSAQDESETGAMANGVANLKVHPTKFTVLMVFPAKWPWYQARTHVRVIKESITFDRITRLNCCVARIHCDSAEEMIELLKKDSLATFSVFGKPRPRIYIERESVETLNVLTVQSTDKNVVFNRNLIPQLYMELGPSVRVINMFHDWDGFVAIVDSAEAVDAFMERKITNFTIDGTRYPVRISEGF